MLYNSIDELDARIEKIIKDTVKYYYSDWKKYDRPKYMGLKGSQDQKDKTAVLIARTSGTYLLTLDQIMNQEAAAAIYEYYYTQEANSSKYYLINIDRLEIGRINQPGAYIQALKTA
jgi:hypothetical protein